MTRLQAAFDLSYMKTYLSAVLFLCLNAGALFAEDMLDGRTYVVEAGKAGEKSGQTDKLVFQNGKFESAFYGSKGYGRGDYRAVATGGVTSFSAETRNKEAGSMSWEGVIKERAIEGKVILTEPIVAKDKIEFKSTEAWFKGSRDAVR